MTICYYSEWTRFCLLIIAMSYQLSDFNSSCSRIDLSDSSVLFRPKASNQRSSWDGRPPRPPGRRFGGFGGCGGKDLLSISVKSKFL
ncbi:hypothetical protein EWB00_005779 [Schistosoma japonicum]|uniref:Uncharacterized protein n=1 Tax=Schistosoma japonicum TaxID=6182 RepID=A0A4Z2D1E5_SCHJA|nr:hypothetical protein EWB00_005779 [Schistosoma japonicum]